jgi:hypothetical protein
VTRLPRQLAFGVAGAAGGAGGAPTPGALAANARVEQLTIERCPYCTSFLAYRGVGRRRITCPGASCRRARRNARARAARQAGRTRSLVLTLILAAFVRSGRTSQ